MHITRCGWFTAVAAVVAVLSAVAPATAQTNTGQNVTVTAAEFGRISSARIPRQTQVELPVVFLLESQVNSPTCGGG